MQANKQEERRRVVVRGGTEPLGTLEEVLVAQGYQLRRVPEDDSVLEALQEAAADLIVVSSSASPKDVQRICQRLAAGYGPAAPPVLIAAQSGEDQIAPLLAAGAADAVRAPFQPEEVAARIEMHLERAWLRAQLARRDAELEDERAARAEAEQALLEAEQSGQNLVENLSEVIYTTDAQGILTYISPAIERLLGYEPTEVIGQPTSRFIHGVQPPVLRSRLEQVLSGETVANEYRMIARSGEMRWVRTSSQPVFSEGKPAGMQGVLTDITERKEAEERIQAQNEFLTSVLESLTHPFYVVDAQDYTIVMANSAARFNDAAGSTTCYALTHRRDTPCDLADHPCPLREIKQTKRPASVEHIHYDADGKPRYFEVYGYPLFDEGGNVARVIEYTLDVTERTEAEHALREAIEAAEAARREEGQRRREAEQRRQVAESLAGVLNALNSNESLEEVLDYIAIQASQLLGGQAAVIYTSQRTVVHDTDGCPPGEPDSSWSQAILRRAMETGKPVAIADVDGGLPEGLEAAGGEEPLGSIAGWGCPYQAVLAVPILVKQQAYGGILLYYAEPQGFLEEQVEVAAIFGDQVALAVENDRLRAQAEEAAASAERSRLARDLHDSVTQALFSASLVAEVLPQVWRRDPEEGQHGLEELRLLTRSALAEMRTLLLELRPTALVEGRLHELLSQLTEATTGRTQLVPIVESKPVPKLPPEVQVVFYRVAQEALHNVVKHARARKVWVHLGGTLQPPAEGSDGWQGQLRLRVRDDGRGLKPEQAGPDQLGLAIMRERAESIGAALTIAPRAEGGTEVTLVWPGA